MTQDIKRRYHDEPEAKSITNYPDPDSVPKSLKDRLAVELVVRATCPECCVQNHFYSGGTDNIVECPTDDCDEEFLLP
jgi:hypothetical protein